MHKRAEKITVLQLEISSGEIYMLKETCSIMKYNG